MTQSAFPELDGEKITLEERGIYSFIRGRTTPTTFNELHKETGMGVFDLIQGLEPFETLGLVEINITYTGNQ